jgi:hypothetical protein
MKKLQQMIDAAFPKTDAKRSPQGPSEAFAERERSFAQTAARVETLRQARVEADRPANAPVLFEVVRHRGSWRILHRGKHTSPFSDQTAAIMAAVKQAKAKREDGTAVEVRLNRTDGVVVVQSLDDETPETAASQGERQPG